METLVASQSEVPGLLPMRECLGVMEDALAALARGDAVLPLRSILWLPERVGLFGLMPAALPESKVAGVKVLTVFPGNEGTELDTHQGAILLFEAERGRLLAIVDATSVTAIRTAAVSGVATRLLARQDAGSLTLVGSGVQARTHLEAMLLVRGLRRIRVASRNFARARLFAEAESVRHGVAIEPVASIEEAVRGADIVCTVTSSRVPVVKGEWIDDGAHVNAVGSSIPAARELDTAAVVRSRFFVDRRESAMNEAGDFLIPKREGAIGDDHILGEIGELLIGKMEGRTASGDVTVFKSLGLAIEDVAAARHIHEKARASGQGLFLPLGGARHEGP